MFEGWRSTRHNLGDFQQLPQNTALIETDLQIRRLETSHSTIDFCASWQVCAHRIYLNDTPIPPQRSDAPNLRKQVVKYRHNRRKRRATDLVCITDTYSLGFTCMVIQDRFEVFSAPNRINTNRFRTDRNASHFRPCDSRSVHHALAAYPLRRSAKCRILPSTLYRHLRSSPR